MSLKSLHKLAERGAIDWLSYYFAEFIARQPGAAADDLLLDSAALVSEAHLGGDVCVELAWFDGAPLFANPDASLPSPAGLEPVEWCGRLAASPVVGAPGDVTPLILDRERLYLYRYWHYENRVADRIQALLDIPLRPTENVESVDLHDLDANQSDAVRRAVGQNFSLISGGPGSGKTSTVVRILGALLRRDPTQRIALTAPTGKAAARLLESIVTRLESAGNIPLSALPRKASTLHRLLGARGDRFSHGRGRPLAFDCVIVDEASMIDLKMMYQLLEALAPGTRLILLGDRDQLASVAAGNVLGDITGHGNRQDDNPPPITDAISLLCGAYRFDSDSAIGSLSSRVNSGNSAGALELLQSSPTSLTWYDGDDDGPASGLLDWVVDAYQPIFEAEDPLAALDVFDSVRVLCITNSGPQGVDRLNSLISAALSERNRPGDGPMEHGQPILITRNHHQLGLYNGDTGILWRFDGRLYACFRGDSGELRRFGLHRLSDHDPAWAVTVHKSQGSEYDAVALLLGSDLDAEGLSREMLYTAITRARGRFVLQGGQALVTRAVTRMTRRHSGLARRLGWPA